MSFKDLNTGVTMPVPKRKLSRSRRGSRSACKFIRPKIITACQTCQAPVMPHIVCQECGYYKGVKILRTKADRMHLRGELMRKKQPYAHAQDNQPIEASADNG